MKLDSYLRRKYNHGFEWILLFTLLMFPSPIALILCVRKAFGFSLKERPDVYLFHKIPCGNARDWG